LDGYAVLFEFQPGWISETSHRLPFVEITRCEAQLTQHRAHRPVRQFPLQMLKDSSGLSEIQRRMATFPALLCQNHLDAPSVAEGLDFPKELSTPHKLTIGQNCPGVKRSRPSSSQKQRPGKVSIVM
jgi:hypothetical protein